jgi:hypothetical protein
MQCLAGRTRARCRTADSVFHSRMGRSPAGPTTPRIVTGALAVPTVANQSSYRILASVARSIAHVTVLVFPASDSVIGDVGANAAKSK